ncbi:hypothetical protein [Arthrobacter sp. ES1]|uniref:hypothetical protein n=1 Tax=Arthrobacter sp. ES1 TaxID=1897056 RepID=UPI001CFFF6D2|nr:hypothetical protein [Arthrobacter sp. ES1]MCB5283718.1 hypothetical protein [Arthrobacter sp. ES1]
MAFAQVRLSVCPVSSFWRGYGPARVLENIGRYRSALRKPDKPIRVQWQDTVVVAVLGKG